VCARGRGEPIEAASTRTAERPGHAAARGPAGPRAGDAPAALASRLADRIGAEGFQRYFNGKASIAMSERGLEVTVPSRFMADLVQRRFGPALREAARDEAGGHDVPVSIVVREQAAARTGDPAAAAAATRPRNDRAAAHPASPATPRHGRTHTWHRLESFIVGESNRLAYSAAVRLADGSGATGDGATGGPLTRLFVHGRCGLGKTHLLQGIARRFQERNPSAVVRYLTGEAFTNEYIAAVRAGAARCEQFRRAYRAVDLLCIDDVHFVANKQATQGELLHTFDAIDLSGARVALASDEHPRQVRSFSEALLSRFLSGAVVRLDHPERDLRERMIAAIAARRGHAIDPAGIRLLADTAGTAATVRDLEGLVTRVEAVWRLMPPGEHGGPGGAIGLLAVQRALGIGTSPDGAALVRRPIRGEQVIAHVCRALGVELAEFTGRGRHKRVVLARAVAANLCRRLTTLSFPEIARAMGRPNHSTIITAFQRLAGQIEARQDAGLDGPFAGLTVGDLCERLAAELAAGA
jgi:chromosomal replication initiator protein